MEYQFYQSYSMIMRTITLVLHTKTATGAVQYTIKGTKFQTRYIFPSNTTWHFLDEVLIDPNTRIEYTFNYSRLFYNAIKTPIPEELKKEPKMHTVRINNLHDFTILNMYFNTIDPKEKLELIKQLL